MVPFAYRWYEPNIYLFLINKNPINKSKEDIPNKNILNISFFKIPIAKLKPNKNVTKAYKNMPNFLLFLLMDNHILIFIK